MARKIIIGYIGLVLGAMLALPGPADVAAQDTITCIYCDGSGEVTCAYCDGNGTVKCNYCDGTGKITCTYCNGTGRIRCAECFGKGYIYEDGNRLKCPTCKGAGSFPATTASTARCSARCAGVPVD